MFNLFHCHSGGHSREQYSVVFDGWLMYWHVMIIHMAVQKQSNVGHIHTWLTAKIRISNFFSWLVNYFVSGVKCQLKLIQNDSKRHCVFWQLHAWVKQVVFVYHLQWLLIVTVPVAVQSLSDELLKYYQQITRAILGDDPHLMKVGFWWMQKKITVV